MATVVIKEIAPTVKPPRVEFIALFRRSLKPFPVELSLEFHFFGHRPLVPVPLRAREDNFAEHTFLDEFFRSAHHLRAAALHTDLDDLLRRPYSLNHPQSLFDRI